MKTFSHVFLASALAVLAGCSVNITRSTGSSEDSSFKVAVNHAQSGEISADLKTLEVDNRYGTVRVVGSDSGPWGWSWKLTVRARNESLAQQTADASVCREERSDGRLRLAVSLARTDVPVGFQSDLEIRAPKSVSVQTQNRYGKTEIENLTESVQATGQSGAVDIRNVAGSVRAQTSYAGLYVSHVGPASLKNQSGRIEAADIHGALDAETSYAALVARDIGGPVKLRNQSGSIEVQAAGEADLKTSYAGMSVQKIRGDARLANQSGKVEARDVSGSVQATTSYASMEIESAGPSVVCNNQSGAIRLQATSAALMNLEARTSYAALEVRLPAGLKPAIQARTSYADIESDFPVLMKPRTEDPFAGLEPGTPRVSLQNQSGKIRVVRD